MKASSPPSRVLWLVCGILILTVVWPLLALLWQSLGPGHSAGPDAGFLSAYGKIFATPGLREMLWNSVWWGVATTAGAWLLGAPCGYLLARTTFPGQSIVRLLLLIPILTPAYLTALGYMMLLQEGGLADALLRRWGGLPPACREFFFGFWGVTFVMVMASFGTVALALEAALRSFPARIEQAAASLGARPGAILGLIILPLMWPVFLNSGVLVFLETISNFGVSVLMSPGADLPLLPAEIYQLLTQSPSDLSLPAALAALLALAALALLSLGRWLLALRGGGSLCSSSHSSNAHGHALGTGGRMLVWSGMGLLFFFSALLPAFVIALTSLLDFEAGRVIGLTGGHYRKLLAEGTGAGAALSTSFLLSWVAATAAVILVGLGGYAMARTSGFAARITGLLGRLPGMVPALVTVVAFLVAWRSPGLVLEIYQTVWLLLLAYFALHQSQAWRVVEAGMKQLDSRLEQTAEILGAGRSRIIRCVVLPVLAPALLVAWVTVFVACLRDWTASILLLPPGFQTIGNFIFQRINEGNWAAAMAMTTLTVLTGTIALVILSCRRPSPVSPVSPVSPMPPSPRFGE